MSFFPVLPQPLLLFFLFFLLGGAAPLLVQAFPTVCSVVKTPQFRSCLELNVGTCLCGWPVPRPCAQFTYYIPETFIEVVSQPGETFFDDLPGVAAQVSTVDRTPFGFESDHGAYSFHAHTITVPFQAIPFNLLPCGATSFNGFCLNAMSEHLGNHWKTGESDRLQPRYLAWQAAPKACLLKGAAESALGSFSGGALSGLPSCSIPRDFLPTYPPSQLPVCSGWGIHYPRYGTATSSTQTGAALMVASRIKSLGSEVFMTVSNSPDEKWQMIKPHTTSCFREGQNLGFLETAIQINDRGRLSGGERKNYLFVVYKKVSCCRDLALIPTTYTGLEMMNAVCQGV